MGDAATRDDDLPRNAFEDFQVAAEGIPRMQRLAFESWCKLRDAYVYLCLE
jgi:hypothetical protein